MANPISSRTPEGRPNYCPVCKALIVIEPSQPIGDAPCPKCGSLLWFNRTSEGENIYRAEDAAPVLEAVFDFLSERYGIGRDFDLGQALAVDSLDMVELVMLLEESYQIYFPEEEADQIRTIADAIDAILRHRLP